MTTAAGSGSAASTRGRTLKRPVPLRESVYEALTEMIIDGTLQPGQRLVEADLAGILGVSRQPVREALQQLNSVGWVDLRPGVGAMVHVPSEDEVGQLLAARAAIESESARLAARNWTQDRVAELREICRAGMAFVEAGEFDEAVRMNAELHGGVTAMSGNKFLIQFAGQVDHRVRWYYTPIAQVRGKDSWHEHERLVDAIAAGDEDGAAQIMREHTEITRNAYHDSQRPTSAASRETQRPAVPPP